MAQGLDFGGNQDPDAGFLGLDKDPDSEIFH